MYLPDPYALTPEQLTDFKLKLLDLQEGEVLADLGCGNAHVLIHAYQLAKTNGIGYELRPEVIREARRNVQNHHLEDRIVIKEESFLDADLSEVDAIFLYLTRYSLGELSLKLEQELKPGARIVTHDFDIPAWKEKEKHQVMGPYGLIHDVYLYIA